jgi:uncharacterized surface protein with fasciclin (FAS1) repeats
LLYLTLSGLVKAANVPAGPDAAVPTAGGDSVYVTNNSKGVYINGIKVVTPDVASSNGVIHVIGRVLLPPSGNIVQVAQSGTSLSYLVGVVLRASQGNSNVAQVLSGNGPYTVFAPVDDAFRAAGFSTINDINSTEPNTLASILTYHVIGGRIFSSDLTNGARCQLLMEELCQLGCLQEPL